VKSALVAGIGNIFLGDDAFGVEVCRRLAGAPLPPGARLFEAGIRTLHLAYEILEQPDLLVIVDAVDRGVEPGTLLVIEPGPRELRPLGIAAGAHGMDVAAVFSTVRLLGGQLPPTRIVGCQPARIEEGIGLSPVVERAVGQAMELVRELLERELGQGAGPKPEEVRA
jgi:hydrogenase maturation protease